jgi:hypothetical protein
MNGNSGKRTMTKFKWKEKVRIEVTNLINEPSRLFLEFQRKADEMSENSENSMSKDGCS